MQPLHALPLLPDLLVRLTLLLSITLCMLRCARGRWLQRSCMACELRTDGGRLMLLVFFSHEPGTHWSHWPTLTIAPR